MDPLRQPAKKLVPPRVPGVSLQTDGNSPAELDIKGFHMRHIIHSALLLLALAAACGPGRTAALSLSARSTSALGAAGAAPASGIQLDRVRLVLRKIELEPAATAPVGGGEDAQAGEVEVAAGPLLLDLSGAALGGSVEHVLDAVVAAGTYRELKIEVRAVSASDAATPGLRDLAARDASVLLDGTIDGQAFTFASSLRAAQKKEGSFAVSAASASNITLQLDPTGWFAGPGGARLDPRLESARAAIEANLASSIDLFQDDDRSGRENHHDRGGQDADGGTSDPGAGCTGYYGVSCSAGDAGHGGGHGGGDADAGPEADGGAKHH